jgi:hypothetical protein
VHILCNKEGREAVNLCFSNGSAADVCFLERLTANCTGSVIEDTGHVTKAKAERLMRRNFFFTAKAMKNMKRQNTQDE